MTFNQNDIDFAFIYSKANEILVTSSVIETFPFKVKQLIEEQSDIRLCSFRKAIQKFGIDIRVWGSESAVLQEFSGAHIIFFNQDEPKQRVRFSLMHEFAHYVLGHEMSLEHANPQYQRQEIEANFFAAQILMPEQLLRTAIKRGYSIHEDYIKNGLGVSKEAAEKRRSTLAKYDYEWRKRAEKEYDDLILWKYASTIDNIAPKRLKQYYDYDDEYGRQDERDFWLDTRSRWS